MPAYRTAWDENNKLRPEDGRWSWAPGVGKPDVAEDRELMSAVREKRRDVGGES